MPISAYEAKTNRKRLSNAYYAGSPLVKILFLGAEEHDFIVFSISTGAVFSTVGKIPLKTTKKTTQGVAVVISKEGVVADVVPRRKPDYRTLIITLRAKISPPMGNFLHREEDNPNNTCRSCERQSCKSIIKGCGMCVRVRRIQTVSLDALSDKIMVEGFTLTSQGTVR